MKGTTTKQNKEKNNQKQPEVGDKLITE